MKTIRILAIVTMVAAVSLLAAVHPLRASAAPTPHVNPFAIQHDSGPPPHNTSGTVNTHSATPYDDYAYDIEAANVYCAGGGVNCVQSAATEGTDAVNDCHYSGYYCPGLMASIFNAYGPYGSTSGTPMEVIAGCQRFTSTGYSQIYDDVTSSYDYDEDADLGSITGNAALLNWFQLNPGFPGDEGEGNVAQPSSAHVSFYDTSGEDYYGDDYNGDIGDHGTISGVQNTDNQDTGPYGGDTLNSGGFNITLTGWIYTYTVYGEPTGNSYWGTMSCLAGGPHAYDLLNAGLDSTDNSTYEFEGEFEPSSP